MLLAEEDNSQERTKWQERALAYYGECEKVKIPTLFDVENGSAATAPKFKDLDMHAIAFLKRAPKKTRGVDYSASYLLIDPSIEHQITMNVFRPNLKDFPTLDERGVYIYLPLTIKQI